jgi:hypothetical protein
LQHEGSNGIAMDGMINININGSHQWNTNGRNDNSQGSNERPLVQHESVRILIEGMTTTKAPM